jgi:hypothetical protein
MVHGNLRSLQLGLLVGASGLLAANTQAAAASGDETTAAAITATRTEFHATLAAGQAIIVDNPYGDVSARFGGFEHATETHAVLQEPGNATHIELEPTIDKDGRYSISPRLPAGVTVADGQRIDLEVFVPEGHAVSVHTDQGRIEVKGVHGDVQANSTTGNISLRGIKGTIRAETREGQIDAALGTAPRKSSQRLATSTGDINIAVDDRLDAELDMATSALFGTEYSLKIVRRPGEEPNKRAHLVIGEDESKLIVESRRGQIRVSRRAKFISEGDADSVATESKEEEQEDNDGD